MRTTIRSNTLKASTEGLRIARRAAEQKGWNCQSPIWYQEAHISLSTLKRFLAGEAIQREIFVAICQAVGVAWEEVVKHTMPINFWHFQYGRGVPDVSDFQGRTEELASIKQWIIMAPRCRVLTLWGRGGIGKTSFAVKLAEQVQSQFDYLIWYSLRPAVPLEQFVSDLLEFFHRNSASEPPQNIQQTSTSNCILELMNFFRNHRCLMILDNLETVLCSGGYAGDYQEQYKNYGNLISCMGEEQHQSCLIVTSREKTKICYLDGKDKPVRSHQVEGLKAARGILAAKELFDENYWEKLNKTYRGNPAILKMVGTTIKTMYSGSVRDFLRQNTIVVGDVYSFIDQQFNRISYVEKDIMCQLAKHKKPVLFPEEFQTILSLSSVELQIALESLMRRSLIEKSDGYITLEPVVMNYVLELKPEGD